MLHGALVMLAALSREAADVMQRPEYKDPRVVLAKPPHAGVVRHWRVEGAADDEDGGLVAAATAAALCACDDTADG